MLPRTEEVMGGQGNWDKVPWRKSRRSGSEDQGGNCVAVAASASYAAIRDTNDPCRATIVLPKAALRGMLDEIKNGAFDLR